MKNRITEKMIGQSVIEVIIAVSIFVIIASSAVVTIVGSLSTTRFTEEETAASSLAEEGIEAVQAIRNKDWGGLQNGTYGLDSSSGSWEFSGTSEVLGKYTRSITISDVFRDQNGDIDNSGGTIDPNIKLVTAEVNWSYTLGRNSKVTLSTYISNWPQNYGSTGVTPTPTPTVTPTPVGSCSDVCVGLGFSSGICRANTGQCNQNGETGEPSGNQYCTLGNDADTCCCQ